MSLDSLSYQFYVDSTYKYFLRNKDGDAKLDKMLDKIDSYDNYQGVEYYRIDDYDFELYRLKRKLIRGEEGGRSDSSIEDIFKEVEEKRNGSS